VSDAEVYDKYAGELIRFAAAVAGPSSAEDVLASAVLNAISSPRWPTIENRRAYLYRSVFNEAAKVRRSAERRLKRELRAADHESHEVTPSDRDVIAALLQLNVRQRAVVYLTYWLDLSTTEVASATGLSPRSVQRDLAAARRRMEELLT
jgi:RNA polymerase sigma factor (sigma-70 family)